MCKNNYHSPCSPPSPQIIILSKTEEDESTKIQHPHLHVHSSRGACRDLCVYFERVFDRDIWGI